MDRFEAFLFLRRALRERARVRRSLGVEAVMEGLAARLGGTTAWGVIGLLAAVDAAFTAQNPARRGLVAAEMLAGQGLAAEGVAAIRDQWRAAPDSPLLTRTLAAAVPAVDLLVEGTRDLAGLQAAQPRDLEGLLEDGSIAPQASRTRVALLAPEGLDAPAMLALARERLLEVAPDVFG